MHDPFSQFVSDFLLSLKLPLPFDQLKLVFCLLLAYPLAFIHSKLPRQPLFQHGYSLIIGVWFAWFNFGWQILHSFGTASATYVLLQFLDPAYSHKVVFVFMTGYLIASHTYRMYTDWMGWSMDFTGPQMLLTLKLTCLAFNIHDGSVDDSELSDFQKSHRLKQLPSLLTYFGWVYTYLGFLAGPAVELNDYVGMTDGTLYAKNGGKVSKDLPPGRFVAAAKAFVYGIICVAIGQYLQSFLTVAFMTSSNYAAMNFFWRVLTLLAFAVAFRQPYYFAWKLSEGSCDLAGLGYSGVDKEGNHEWNNACNANVLQVELAQNIKTVTDGWNLATDHWLKHYIYARLQKTKFKKYDVYLTLLTSAVWHGFYPGYYMSFVTAAMIVNVARMARRVFRPRFMDKEDPSQPGPYKPLYDALTFVLHQVVFNYVMIPFIFLDWHLGYNFWKVNYFYGHILLVLGLIALPLMGGNKRSSSSKPHVHKATPYKLRPRKKSQ